MRVGVRAASVEDLEAAASLIAAAAAEAVTQRGGRLLVEGAVCPGPLVDGLAERLADQKSLLWLGLLDDVPLGVLLARVERPSGGSSLLRIEAIYVEPAAREVGLGEALLDSAAALASERGVGGLDVTVLPGARETKNFFESAGFVARCIVMHKRADGSGDVPPGG